MSEMTQIIDCNSTSVDGNLTILYRFEDFLTVREGIGYFYFWSYGHYVPQNFILVETTLLKLLSTRVHLR